MSVGEKERNIVSHDSCDGHATHIKVTDSKEPRKLAIESHDEVYYPMVSIIRKSNAQSVPTTELPSPSAEQATDTPDDSHTTTRARRSSLKIWWSRLGTVATSVIVLVVATLIGARLLGFRMFTVMSGSMSPEYPVGAMIYVRPVDYRELKAGDVISYVADSSKTIVTHRIVDVEIDEKDSSVYRFKTKGDANSSPDSNLVHYNNVLGTPVITIPLIGYIVHNIQQPPGIYIMLVVGTLLLAWTFLPGTLEGRRKTARKSVTQ